MRALIVMSLVALAGCQSLTPATLKTACDAIGGKRTYTADQLKVLSHDQKVRDATSNDFYDKNCKGR